MPKLLLLDGYSLAYRAFYALPSDLSTPAGTITNAVYGFTSMLVKVLTDEAPDYIAVAFDAPGRTFRDDLDVDYKATRKETPDIFASQIPLIHEVVDALRIPSLTVEGVEADDVIATLATRADAEGIDVVIVTGDRDSYQLVHDPHIRVLYNRRGVSDYVLYDETGILERTGVTAARYPEYAALRGDPSDNLPGVPGIGEKTAAKLVTTYGSLEGIFEHLEELPPKQRANLAAARERALLNRQMSRLERNVDVGLAVADLRQGAWDREQVRVLFDQLAFRTLLPRLLAAVGETSAEPEVGPDALDVEVTLARDAAAARAVLERVVVADDLYSIEPRWHGAPVTSGIRAIAVASGTGVATVIDEALLAAPEVRGALDRASRARWCAARRPPREGPDARARSRHPIAARRHRRDGVPARPGRGQVPPRRPGAAVPRCRGALGRCGAGEARLRRWCGDRPRRAARGRRAPARERARRGARRP